MRWLVLLVSLSACTRALDTPLEPTVCEQLADEQSCLAAGCALVSSCGCPGEPAFPGCTTKGTASPNFCTAGCAEPTPSCDSLTTAAACAARTDCWALLTFDEMCDSEGCASHFTSCDSGKPLCDAEDASAPGVCDPGDEYALASDGTAIGCVLAGKCPTN